MRAHQGVRGSRSVWTALLAAWLLGAAWSIATAPTTASFPAWRAPYLAVDLSGRPSATQATQWPSQDGSSDERSSSDEAVEQNTPERKRGIRPPWRENAIPELRKQPGQKPKNSTA